MKKHLLFCIAIILLTLVKAAAQDGYNERAKKYIEQYYPLAIAEQKSSGIPASITLGQGILETEAGASELMTIANNHFGIKCTNGWTGLTFTHTDDAPNECFKKYACAADSYKDHSQHLKRNPRYAPLFTLSPTDYASWAVCLKKCGYATNPQYAQQLIKIIEDFKLQEYTFTALDSSYTGNYPAMANTDTKKTVDAYVVANNKEETTEPQSVTTTISDSSIIPDTAPAAGTDNNDDNGKILTVNGMKAIYANKGEILLRYADEYHIRYARLLEMNDLPDAPLPFSMNVYLEKKLTSGTHPKHTVVSGETLFMVSQAEGIQLKKLMALNLLNPNEEPVAGTVLELQATATRKPDVKMSEIKAHKGNAIVTYAGNDTEPADDYIATSKLKETEPKPEVKSQAAVPVKPAVVTPVTKATIAAYVPPRPAAVQKENTAPTEKETADAKQEAANDAALASLKADLDKVVYADNSKLPTEKTRNIPALKKEPMAVQEQPVTREPAKYYTIKRGETAFSIAKRNNLSVDELLKLNKIDAKGIKAGSKIIVKE